MPNLTKLPTWADKKLVHAVVETPRGSRCKLEFDTKLRAFALAKPLLVGLTYPYDWGFIPSTKAEDGDPLDVLMIHDAATYPGLVLRSALSKWSKSLTVRKKGTTGFSRCPSVRLSRGSYKMCADCPHGQSRNWRNFSRPPMRSKIKN